MLRRLFIIMILVLSLSPLTAHTRDLCDISPLLMTKLYGTCTTSTVALDQMQQFDVPEFGGTITVHHPQNWVAQNSGGAILIATSEEALAIEDPSVLDEIPKGAVIISLTIIPADMVAVMGIEGEATPTALLELFTDFMVGENIPEFGDIEEFTIDDTPAARAIGSDDTLSATLYAIDKNGNFTFAFGATRSDEADIYAEVVQAIIASAEFTANE